MRKNKLVYGIGISDLPSVTPDGKRVKSYKVWQGILQRCYSNKWHKNKPTYIGCTVCEEWLTFSNFKKFYDNNYRDGFHLDKDILLDGNKEYSDKACRFIPAAINSLFTDSGAARGNLPLGVSVTRSGRYRVRTPQLGNPKGVCKTFNSPEEAHLYYLKEKRKHCLSVATKYLRDLQINQEIYEAILTKANNLV